MNGIVRPAPLERSAGVAEDPASPASIPETNTPSVRTRSATDVNHFATLQRRTAQRPRDAECREPSDIGNTPMGPRQALPTHAGACAEHAASGPLPSSAPPPPPVPVGEAAVIAPAPNDWVAQSTAMQRSLAELGQKAAVETARLKLQNDLNDSTVSLIKNIGSSVKSAAQ